MSPEIPEESFGEEELLKDIDRAYSKHEVAALLYLSDFRNKLMDSPAEAIDEITERYNRALNEAYTDDEGKNVRGFVEAVAGGPHERIPRIVYNAVGSVYPYLEREQRDKALGEIFKILDKRNYFEVQISHTCGIREPLLLGDIFACRSLYWPGLYDEKKLWSGKSFEEVKDSIIDENGLFKQDKVISDFLVAYALLRKDVGNMGRKYVEVANPNFLNRVLKGIVAIYFARVHDLDEVEKKTANLKKILPKSLHSRLDLLREEADWVDYTKFP
jgi:hypothetical protein